MRRDDDEDDNGEDPDEPERDFADGVDGGDDDAPPEFLLADPAHASAGAAAATTTAEPREESFRVTKNFTEARRLDAYLVARVIEREIDLSRAEVQRMIEDGRVTVNEHKVKPSTKIKCGDVIRVRVTEQQAGKPLPQEIPLDIVYEDDDLVVINKQANMLTHPGRGRENWAGTLINALQFHFDRLSSIGGPIRPGIVHRLDRDTTGVIVVAKDDRTHRNLGRQFEQRRVKKEYLALCYGVPDRDRDIVQRRIGPHPSVREKMAIRDDPAIGREATTFFEVAERFAGFSLIRCEPKTGRTHQIRVHLDHVGLPILADKAYSGRQVVKRSDITGKVPVEDTVLLSRQALHAHRLWFRHPADGRPMDFQAPLPADMASVLDLLREWRKAE